MAQQIHPSAFRLAIEKSWYSQIETEDKGLFLQHDLFIREFLSGYFLAQGWLTSEIIIQHQAQVAPRSLPPKGGGGEQQKVRVKFMVYRLSEKIRKKLKNQEEKKSLIYLVKYLGYFLKSRNPRQLSSLPTAPVGQIIEYEFDVRETKSFCDNAKILADWIDVQISQEARQYRSVLLQVIREIKRVNDAKMK